MSRSYQVVPPFVSVELLDDISGLTDDPILFDIINTDGESEKIYDSSLGTFTSPLSGWYDMEVTLQGTLTKLYFVKNGNATFPVHGVNPTGVGLIHTKKRLILSEGETISIFASGGVTADSKMSPNAKASNAIFTLVKTFSST